MKKSLLGYLKTLLIAALTAGALWSCQDEKPEIHFPDPIIPQKEFKHVETITQDTLTFNQGDSVVFRMRTIPVNLLSRQDVTVQVSDTAGSKYEFAQIKSYKLGKDSIWSVVMDMTYGMKSGDRISIMVADADTVIYSDETVLDMIPAEQPLDISLRIMNKDSIAAFVDGTRNITVSLRVNPFDLFFGDSASLYLTDSLEHSLRKKYSLGDLQFQPSDSTWNARIDLLEEEPTESYILFKMILPDTAIISSPVYIRKADITMSSVKVGNDAAMKLDAATNTWSYFMATVTNFSNQKFLFEHNGEKVTVGDSLLLDGEYNYLNVNKPLTVSVWKYGAHKDYIIKMYNTGLPVVRINTGGKSVTRRDTWVEGATMRIDLPDGTVAYQGSLSLKGRGNGTWTETEKKPYALKLDEKAKILGMHKQKRWCLLANYKDRTLLRNDAAFWLSRHTQMPYTVEGRFVELVWNGQNMGNYYLCEQIRIDNHRVDIAEPNLSDPANGGFLMVIDGFLDYTSSDRYDKENGLGFWSSGSKSRYRLPYILKDPDEDENGNKLTKTSAPFLYIQNYVNEMEDAIYGLKTNSNNSKVKQYLDYDRAIDYVLIQELTMNHDSYNTWPQGHEGPHSGYVYKDAGGKLCYGPVWDFDYHTFTLYNDGSNSWNSGSGENPRIKQWELLTMDNKGNNKYYFADLAKYDPEFRERLVARWNDYKDVWKDSLPIYIDQMANYIRLSETYNDTRWTANKSLTNYKQNGDYNLTFQQAVDAMKTAFLKRWDWIDKNITKLGK